MTREIQKKPPLLRRDFLKLASTGVGALVLRSFPDLVWLLPVIAVLLGVWVACEILKSWRSKEPAVTSSPVRPQVAPEVLARIEKELQELD